MLTRRNLRLLLKRRFARRVPSLFTLSLWCGLAVLVAIVYWLPQAQWLPSTNASTPARLKALPNLQGGAAITYLKEQGLYASLAGAMAAARSVGMASGGAANDGIGKMGDQSSSSLFVICNNLVERQKLIDAGGQFIDWFGQSVALSGDTAVIGAPMDDNAIFQDVGSAHVFVRSGTSWVLQQRLTASDETGSAQFGVSVAISGDTVLIGAIFANGSRGAAYVFVRSGTSWSQQQRLIANDGVFGDIFGISVALSGDTAVIGASDTTMARGSAYVFVRSGTSWSLQEELLANDGVTDDNFGVSVAITGDTVVVGAYQDDFSVFANIGSAYVFVRTGTSWSQQQKLIPTGGQSGDLFGYAVALSGETVVIGAPGDDIGTNESQGSAYIFVRTGSTWSQQQNLTANDGGQFDGLGSSVAIVGDTVVVGAVQIGVSRPGSAYVFVRSGTTWSQQQKLIPSDGAVNDEFGRSVALSGDTVVVGARYGDSVFPGIGSAYVFGCGSNGSGLQFYPLPSPVRLLETRSGFGGCTTPGSPINANSTFTLPARTSCAGIPASAAAVTGNITVVPSGAGYLTLFPSSAARPTVANSNFKAGEITNNVFTVGLGAGDGAFKIFSSATTHVIVDVTGYYAPPGTGGLYFHPLPNPVRLLETRGGFSGCIAPGTPLVGTGNPNADPNLDLLLQGRSPIVSPCNSIPASAQVLVGNATSVLPSGGGYLTIYPSGGARPTVASSNYTGGDVINGPFAVKLGADGKFKVYTYATTHLVIDILGYYSEEATDTNGTGLLFTPLATPARLLETRPDFPGFPLPGCFRPNAPLGTGQIYTQQGRNTCTVPNTARALVGNATVVNPIAGGFLTFWPSDAPSQPTVATSNYPFPVVFGYNRHFIVGLGAGDGAFKMYPQFQTDLIVDVSGYFAP